MVIMTRMRLHKRRNQQQTFLHGLNKFIQRREPRYTYIPFVSFVLVYTRCYRYPYRTRYLVDCKCKQWYFYETRIIMQYHIINYNTPCMGRLPRSQNCGIISSANHGDKLSFMYIYFSSFIYPAKDACSWL